MHIFSSFIFLFHLILKSPHLMRFEKIVQVPTSAFILGKVTQDTCRINEVSEHVCLIRYITWDVVNCIRQ